MITRRTLIASSAILASSVAAPVFAQSDKPIRFILPVGAGSGVDGIARAAGPSLAKALGQAVVFENQPGAGGVVGTAALVKSVSDGQTLSIVSNNHVIYPSVLKSLPFDPLADISPIALLGATPMVLVVNPAKVAAKNMQELVALLKASPGKYNYASSGNGTILHLAMELFKEVTNTFVTHIPYRGFGDMLRDIVGGQVDMGVGALPAVLAQVKSGALRAICIASPQRSAAAPDIATAVEQGFPRYVVDGWFAAVAPKGLPAAQLKRLHEAFASAFASDEVKTAMARQGNSINVSSPEVTAAFFKSELAKYAALVKRAGVVAQ